MSFFDKFKAAVGIGQPDLKIEVAKNEFYHSESIEGKLILTGSKRAVPVKELVVFLLHSYTLKDQESSVLKGDEYFKVTIDLGAVLLNENEVIERDFSIQLSNSIVLTESSKLAIKAYADIPGLDAKDSVRITLTDQKPLINWREKITTLMNQLKAIPSFTVSELSIGDQIDPSEITLPLHEDVKHFYSEVNGFYFSGYYVSPKTEKSYGFHAYIPELDRIMETKENNAEYYTIDNGFFFNLNDESLNYNFIKFDSNRIGYIVDGSIQSETYDFNEYIKTWIDTFFYNELISCLEIDRTGNEYTNAHSLLKSLFKENIGVNEKLGSALFTNYISLEKQYDIVEPTGNSEGIIAKVHVKKEIESIILTNNIGVEEVEDLGGGRMRTTVTNPTYRIGINRKPEIGEVIEIDQGVVPNGDYSFIIFYTDGSTYRTSIVF